jgi:hypothetical protein
LYAKKPTTLLLVTFALLLGAVYAVETFTVPPSQQVVRAISLKEGDIVSGTITASGGSGKDINFYVTDPHYVEVLRYDRATHASFSFVATLSGTYTMHFDNSFSWISGKSVTLDYSVKTSILGMPQDIFYIILALIIIAVVVILIVVALKRHRRQRIS